MILTGFAGQVSLGHGAFLAIGAYAAAILGGTLGVPFWLVLPAAGAFAALVGLAVGPFALRLEGLYLAIVTLGLLMVVEHVLRNGLELAYGKDYLSVPMHGWFADRATRSSLGSFRSDANLFGLVFDSSRKLYLLFLALAACSVWLGKNLARSNTGRAMMAVRDRDLAAACLGVDCAKTKIIAFGVSSFLAGIAGAMYGFAHPVVTPEPFGLKMSVEYVAMVVFGGIGTMFGAVAGAIAFAAVLPIAEWIGSLLPFPAGFSSQSQAVLVFYPLLCVFLALEPLGLFGVWLRVQRYFAAWPFRY
jgi:branched-chain amino acid transport system permease protein